MTLSRQCLAQQYNYQSVSFQAPLKLPKCPTWSVHRFC